MTKALTYIGYFVPMKTWFRFVASHAEQTASLGVLRSIAPLLTGVDRDELINNTENMFDQLFAIILKSDYTENFQVSSSVDSLTSLSLGSVVCPK